MVTNGTGERMLSDDERELLTAYTTTDPATYPIEQLEDGWTWRFRSLQAASPAATKEEAAEKFEAYLGALVDSARAEENATYGAMPKVDTPDVRLLSAAIDASGLSVRKFAKDVLVREPRTVWRWLAGDNALPAAVRVKLEAMIAASPSEASE